MTNTRTYMRSSIVSKQQYKCENPFERFRIRGKLYLSINGYTEFYLVKYVDVEEKNQHVHVVGRNNNHLRFYSFSEPNFNMQDQSGNRKIERDRFKIKYKGNHTFGFWEAFKPYKELHDRIMLMIM